MGTNKSSMQFSQSQEIDLSKRKWKGMKEINLDIKRAQDIEGEGDKLTKNLLVEKGYKIKLILTTVIEDDAAATKFFGCMEKLNNKEIFYLKWKVCGKFTDEKSSMIGDLISGFIQLYSLDLYILGGQFQGQGLLSLARCFKKLQNLHVLELDHPFFFKGKFTKKVNIMKFLQAISDIKTLEILDQNIDTDWQIQLMDERQKDSANINDSLNNLSTFIYQLDIQYINFQQFFTQEEQKQMLVSLKKNLEKNKNKISKIIFFDKFGLNNLDYVQPRDRSFFNQSIVSCFSLPYLTSFKDRADYQNLENPFIILLNAFLKERQKKILEIIEFHFDISKLCCFNPQWALNDLYFD